MTEADVRLMPTAVRFDGVYASFFRCGRKQIRSDYPHVARWTKEMLALTGPALFDLADARNSYYTNLLCVWPIKPPSSALQICLLSLSSRCRCSQPAQSWRHRAGWTDGGGLGLPGCKRWRGERRECICLAVR